MTSKRFKKLTENTSEIAAEGIEKLIPLIKKIALQNLMSQLI